MTKILGACELTRRNFIKSTALVAGGAALGAWANPNPAAAAAEKLKGTFLVQSALSGRGVQQCRRALPDEPR